MTKDSNHYVDNKKFYEEIKKHQERCQKADEKGKSHPKIPEYVAECFLLIAQRYANKPQFVNYSYKEDMVMDSVENCLRYINTFNPEKSNNAFAYFTRTIHRAYLRTIEKEGNQSYIKNVVIEDAMLHNDNSEILQNRFGDEYSTEKRQESIKKFQDKLQRKKEKARAKKKEKQKEKKKKLGLLNILL